VFHLYHYTCLYTLRTYSLLLRRIEAHQGQSGESARTLRSSLIDVEEEKKVFAEENDMNPDAIGESMIILLLGK